MTTIRQALGAFAIAAFATQATSAHDLEITHADQRTVARGPETAYTGVGIAEMLFLANDKSDLTTTEISFEPGAYCLA